jgi:polysaccharide export outer membrane protein
VRKFLIFLALAPALALAACGGGPKLGQAGSAATLVDARELPAPTLADTQGTRAYLIAPLDTVAVEVFAVPDLSRPAVQVGADGRLDYPLAGTVVAGGKTPSQLAETLEGALRGRFVKNPQVTVTLKETVSQRVTVDGAVQSPGLYPVVGNMTLMRAVATAKGLNQDGNAQRVVVLRTVGGQKMAALYNLAAIRNGVYADPEIYPNDVVLVGDQSAKRFFRDALTVISTFSYPLVAIVQGL